MIKKLQKRAHEIFHKLHWLPQVATRLSVGIVFAQSGWGKLHHLSDVTAFFEKLGIPMASIQAPFVATCELVFGVTLMLGFLSRISAFFLSSIMVVALITAKREEIESILSLPGITDFLYLLLLLWILIEGAGRISLDHILWGKKK